MSKSVTCRISGKSFTFTTENFNKRIEEYPDIDKGNKTTFEHLGTLGTGNHFIEMCYDTNNQVWIMMIKFSIDSRVHN